MMSVSRALLLARFQPLPVSSYRFFRPLSFPLEGCLPVTDDSDYDDHSLAKGPPVQGCLPGCDFNHWLVVKFKHNNFTA